MDDICEVIDDAKKEVLIACDYAGFGAFSEPDKFGDYVAAISKAAANPNCTIYCIVGARAIHGAARKAKAMAAGEKSYRDNLRDGTFRELLGKLAKKQPGREMLQLPAGEPTSWSYADYRDAVERLERCCADVLRPLMTDKTIHQAASAPPLYLWITESRAVWAIPPMDPLDRLAANVSPIAPRNLPKGQLPFGEHGFVTTDTLGLVARLRNVWHHYRRQLPRPA
jgi:hypothetical protein